MKLVSPYLFNAISRYATLVLLILVPVFALPFLNFNFIYIKVGAMHLLVLIGLGCYVLKSILERKIEIPSIALAGTIALVVLLSFITAFYSDLPNVSFMSTGVEIDTLYMTVLLAAAGYLASLHIRTKKSVLQAAVLYVGVAFVTAIFYGSRFLFGSEFLSFGVFNLISSNTIGSLADIAIYSSVALLLTALLAETLPLRNLFRYFLYAGGICLAYLAIVTNFNIVAGITKSGFAIPLSAMTAIFLAIIGSYTLRLNKRVPYFSASLAIVFVIVSTWAMPISKYVAQSIGLTEQEAVDIRVSPLANMGIISGTYTESIKMALFGSGQGTFFSQWAKYKTTDLSSSVNITPFWDNDFNFGASYIGTLAVTSGLLGLVGWILFLYLLCVMLYRTYKTTSSWFLVFGIPALYLALTTLFYTPGIVCLLLFFMTISISFGLYAETKNIPAVFQAASISITGGLVRVVSINTLLILTLIASGFVSYRLVEKAQASYYIDQTLVTMQGGIEYLTPARELVLKAIQLDLSNTYLRFLSELTLIKPGQALTAGDLENSAGDMLRDADSDLSVSIRAAESAAYTNGASNDYRDWIQLGNAYETATFLGSTTTAPLTIRAYAHAEFLAPTNPVPPYLIARILYYAGDNEAALNKVREALTLKPDYTPALELFKILNETHGS